MTHIIVSDAGPLISCYRAGLLHLFRSLYGEIVVPPVVRSEIKEVFDPEWMQVRAPRLGIAIQRSLDPGEAQAILLALECRQEMMETLLLIDDLAGQRAAEFFGLKITGSLGVLLAAKRAGLLPVVAPAIARLTEAGAYFHDSIIRDALDLAGEST